MDDLEKGRIFSIIKLNCTGNEPTHIYDPSDSLLFAWKEIYKHWEIAFQISLSNKHTGKQQLITFDQWRNMYREHRKHLGLLNTI